LSAIALAKEEAEEQRRKENEDCEKIWNLGEGAGSVKAINANLTQGITGRPMKAAPQGKIYSRGRRGFCKSAVFTTEKIGERRRNR